MSDAEHRCSFVVGRGGYERCPCGGRFPCRDDDCGHSDCIERRGTLSLCHYCRRRVEGEKHDLWTSWLVWGHTRTVHYKCRDERAKPEELVRWYGAKKE